MDPANDTAWIGGIKTVQVLTDPPLGPGTRVARVAAFLGKRIEYVNEVVEYNPPARLVMRSVKGPFPMTVTYEFEAVGDSTIARIRVQGAAEGFYRLAAPLLVRAVRMSLGRDLRALAALMERRAVAQG